jgi:hypothetical protein
VVILSLAKNANIAAGSSSALGGEAMPFAPSRRRRKIGGFERFSDTTLVIMGY